MELTLFFNSVNKGDLRTVKILYNRQPGAPNWIPIMGDYTKIQYLSLFYLELPVETRHQGFIKGVYTRSYSLYCDFKKGEKRNRIVKTDTDLKSRAKYCAGKPLGDESWNIYRAYTMAAFTWARAMSIRTVIVISSDLNLNAVWILKTFE